MRRLAPRRGELVRKTAIHSTILSAVIVGFSICAIVITPPGHAASGKIFAQRLVEETLPKHPEVTGLEISAITKAGCKTIAATDPKDLEEKCDKDELQPLQTGEPFVDQERDGFDVTLPLHDKNGQIIAAVGLDFKAASGQTKASVLKQGQQIVTEMESQVSSKDKLFQTESRLSISDPKNEAKVRGR
jgi:hypothetical protein